MVIDLGAGELKWLSGRRAAKEESYHFDRLKNSVRIYEWLKSEMFPIAFNTFGDYIMIRVNDNANRGIYFYYHDKPSKYIELAEDFVSFVKKCKSKKLVIFVQ